jgi:hypothetical protein
MPDHRHHDADIRHRWNEISSEMRCRIIRELPLWMKDEIRKELGLGYGPSNLTAPERAEEARGVWMEATRLEAQSIGGLAGLALEGIMTRFEDPADV